VATSLAGGGKGKRDGETDRSLQLPFRPPDSSVPTPNCTAVQLIDQTTPGVLPLYRVIEADRIIPLWGNRR